MNKEKTKEVKLKMRFNPGLQKYEPELPLKKTKRKTKVKINWLELVPIIIGVILLMIILFIIMKWLEQK